MTAASWVASWVDSIDTREAAIVWSDEHQRFHDAVDDGGGARLLLALFGERLFERGVGGLETIGDQRDQGRDRDVDDDAQPASAPRMTQPRMLTR